MSELSIFVDESGDFGKPEKFPSYYLVTFVIHKQSDEVDANVAKLDDSLRSSGFDIDYIHMGPIIRREEAFKEYSLDERRSLTYKMLNFYNKCEIKHHTVVVNRKEASDKIALSGRLAKQITQLFSDNIEFFNEYDKIIVYYDNGQVELSSLLNAILSSNFANVEFRKAAPQQYKLLQVADFVCTFELLNLKRQNKILTNSETKFFYKSQELTKTFIKAIKKKRIE